MSKETLDKIIFILAGHALFIMLSYKQKLKRQYGMQSTTQIGIKMLHQRRVILKKWLKSHLHDIPSGSFRISSTDVS